MKKEIIEKLASLITAAFGLVAALAWNDTIQTIFKRFYNDNGSIIASVIYATIVTIIAVIATMWIGKLSESKTKMEGK